MQSGRGTLRGLAGCRRDNPAREYNRPPDAELLDVPGLLIIVGLVVAGFVLALVLTKHIL